MKINPRHSFRFVQLVTACWAFGATVSTLFSALSPAPVRPGDGVANIYAIFIGNSTYFGWKDARDTYLFLRNTHGARAEDMFVLLTNTGTPTDYADIVDGQATVPNLEAALAHCAANMDADDIFLWQMEAHGNGYVGRVADDPHNVAYHGYFGVPPRIAQGNDERDFLERDLELSVFCGNGLLDGKDYHYGMGQWGVSWYQGFQILKRVKALSHFTNIYVEGRGYLTDNDVRIERFIDYALGDLNKNGAIDPGEVADFDGDGIPPYDRETGAFDDDDWGAPDFFEDNIPFGHSFIPGVNFTLFDAGLDNHVDIDINPGAVLEVDGTDFDNDGCIDGFDLNDDGNLDSWVAMDETLSITNTALTDDQIRVYLDVLTNGTKVVVTSTCHGGGFIHDLSGPNTFVLAGGRELCLTSAGIVHECFRAAFTTYKTQADADGNGLVSFTEAINFARIHPWTSMHSSMDRFMYDDNGDRVGHEMPLPNGGDGVIGAHTYWELGTVVDVSALTVSPNLISPNGDGRFDSASISATINLPAAWMLNVRNGNGDIMKTTSGSGTSVAFTWDGSNDSGTVVPDGVYTIEVVATASTGVTDTATSTVTVDNTAMDILPLSISPSLITPNGDGVSESAAITTDLNVAASWTLVIRDGLGSTVKLTAGSSASIAYDWNGTDFTGQVVPNGVYSIEVTATAPNGTVDVETGSVTVDKTLLDVGPLAIAPAVFSPNGDGHNDTVSIEAAINAAAPWTLAIRDSVGTIVKTAAGWGLTANYTWDGTDDSGAALSNGSYTIQITATASNGTTDSASGAVGIDKTVVNIGAFAITPSLFTPNGDNNADTASISGTVNVAVTWTLAIHDSSGTIVRTVSGSGANIAFTWDGRDDTGVFVADGVYTVQLSATAANGSADQASGVLTADKTLLDIQSLAIAPAAFSPNADGVDDVTSITAALNASAAWTVTIRNNSGSIVKTASGSGTSIAYTWNGTDASGTVLGDGIYTVQVTATAANGTADQMSGSVTIDKVKPVVSNLRDSRDPFRASRGETTTISFTLSEGGTLNVAVYNSSNTLVRTLFSGATSTLSHALIWNGRNQTNALLPSGVYTYRVTVVDAAGNTSQPAQGTSTIK